MSDENDNKTDGKPQGGTPSTTGPRAPLSLRPRQAGSVSTGTVKWFNDAKGYGFITPEGGGQDLFAHYKEIQGSGFRSLKEGQRVEFEVREGPKGLQASQIRGL